MYHGKVQQNPLKTELRVSMGKTQVWDGLQKHDVFQIPKVFVEKYGLVQVWHGFGTGLKSTRYFWIRVCLSQVSRSCVMFFTTV